MDLNRPRDALAAIPDLTTASNYGNEVAALVRVMAASELADSAAQEIAVAQLRAHAARRGPQLAGLLVAGLQDEAAQALIARLSDPDLVSDALLELQDYHEDPAPEQVQKWRAQLRQLRARPDVRQAIRTHGRIDDYSLPGLVF